MLERYGVTGKAVETARPARRFGEEGATWRDSVPVWRGLGLGSGLILSFLSLQFTTTVVSCRPAELQTEGGNCKKVLSGFHVVLEDTLLFPEGGGQVPSQSLPRKPQISLWQAGNALLPLFSQP